MKVNANYEGEEFVWGNKSGEEFSFQGRLTLHLTIDAQDRVSFIRLHLPQLELTSAEKKACLDFCQAIIEQPLHIITDKNFFAFCPPLFFSSALFFLLHAFQRPLINRIPLTKLKNQKSEGLVCRCFGIFETEVKDFLQNHPESLLMTITESLFAGAACQSCLPDLQKIYNQWGEAKGVVKTSSPTHQQVAKGIHPHRKPYYFSVGGKSYSPYELVLFLEEELNRNFVDVNANAPKIFIHDLNETHLQLNLVGFSREQGSALKPSLILFLHERLALDLVLTFLIDGIDSP